MRLHIRAKQRIHSRLIPGTLLFKPFNNVRVDSKGQKGFLWRGFQAFTRDGARKHLRRPLWCVAVAHYVGVDHFPHPGQVS